MTARRRRRRAGATFTTFPYGAATYRRRPPSGGAVLTMAFLAGMFTYGVLLQVALAIVEAVNP